jgi:hypothetical protein
MYSYDIRNDKLGLNFNAEFEFEPNEEDIWDVMKSQVDTNQVLDLIGKPNTTAEDKALAVGAWKNGWFDAEQETDFFGVVKDVAGSVMDGGGKMFVTMPVSKKRIQGIRNNLGGMQTEHESMLDNQIRQALDVAGNTTERPKRSWEEFDKETQDKINKASIRLAENSYSENMNWDDGGGMDYLQQALANEDLSMNDPALQKAVADRAYNFADLKVDATLYQAIGEWAGGYDLLGEMAGHELQTPWFEDESEYSDETILKEVELLKTTQNIVEVMEDSAGSLARALGNRDMEIALKKGQVEPDRDIALFAQVALAPENASGGLGAIVSQTGKRSVQTLFPKWGYEAKVKSMGRELMIAHANVNKATEKIARLQKAESIMYKNASKVAPARTQKLQKIIKDGIEESQETLTKFNPVIRELQPKFINLQQKLAKPPMFRSGMGVLATTFGIGADGAGRLLELLARMPKELAVDTLMKYGAKSAEDANNILRNTGLLGGGVLGYTALDKEWDIDGWDVINTTAIAMSPRILQTGGTTLRHLGKHWSQSIGTKNSYKYFQQLDTQPKLSDALVDRTQGASYVKTIGNVWTGVMNKGGAEPVLGRFFPNSNLMPKQGVTTLGRGIARRMVSTGFDKVADFVGRTGVTAVGGSLLPTGLGYLAGGEEGAGAGLGASLPFLIAGMGVGEVLRLGSTHGIRVKQRGDIKNHADGLTSTQKDLYLSKLDFETQAGVASAQMQFPDLEIVIEDGAKGTANGSYEFRNGKAVAYVNVNGDAPLMGILAHEIGHHIKAHGLTPMVHEILFGSVAKNKPGIYTDFQFKKDAQGNVIRGAFGKPVYDMSKPIIENNNGIPMYKLNDKWRATTKRYGDLLKQTKGLRLSQDDLDAKLAPESIADEIFAEEMAHNILSQGKPFNIFDQDVGFVAKSLFSAISGQGFLTQAGMNMGLGNDALGNGLFSTHESSKQLQGLINEFKKESGRKSKGEMEGTLVEDDYTANDVIITPAQQKSEPATLTLFEEVFVKDDQGNIIYNVGGQPKLMTEAQLNKINRQMGEDLVDIIEKEGNLPLGHVQDNGEGAEGLFLSKSVIDKLEAQGNYSPKQISYLRQVSESGRKIDAGIEQSGNEFVIFYYPAMKGNKKLYKTLRGGYRPSIFYGIQITKDNNVVIQTLSMDTIEKNISKVFKNDTLAKNLRSVFGGTTISETRGNIKNKMTLYHKNHHQKIENGKQGSNISMNQKDWINAFLGNMSKEQVANNPILQKLGKKMEPSTKSRRLDRIGSIDGPNGSTWVDYHRGIKGNLMPSRGEQNSPGQMDLGMGLRNERTPEYFKAQSLVDEQPSGANFYKMYGIDPKDPKVMDRVADVLILKGNRSFNQSIAESNADNFGFELREFVRALDKAQDRAEWNDTQFMPNLGLKDNVVDQVLPAINQEKFSGEQFNSAIGKVAGAKAYADDIGLTGFLEGKKSVTKTDIEDFVAENHLKLDSYDLADPVEILNIDDLLARFQTDEELYTTYPNLRYHKEGFTGMLASLESIDDLKRAKKDGYTQARTNYSDRTKYNRSTLVTPGERTNYNETLVEFEGGGRFEVPESSTLQYEGVIEFADPDLIDDFLTDMSIGGHEELNYGREYKEDLMDAVEVVTFKGNAEEYKIIKEVAENYKFDGVTITPGESRVPLPGGAPTYKNTHWNSDKVIGHIRRTDRTINGKDTRFLEEMQSDWLQALRKGNAPDAPFAKNWPALLLKKAMMDAINDGKTHIAWADGKVHNDRYSLTRTLDDITMEPGNIIGIREIFLNTKEQGDIQLQVDSKGRVINADHEGFIGKGLDEVIGKQMADKILEEPSWDHKHENFRKTIKYEGKDLDLSDPALPNFYDKEVVKVATKLAKKLGVGKPEKVKVAEHSFDEVTSETTPSNGAWMMELPTKQALGEQTLYMPTLGNEAPKGPSSPPEVVQSNSMARRIKYKGIPAQEISNRIAQVSTELLEYGSDSNPQVESTRGSLYQAKRNGIIRELNELNEVEAGMLNQGKRFMPAKDGKEIYQMSSDDFKKRGFMRETDDALTNDYYNTMKRINGELPIKEILNLTDPKADHKTIVEQAIKDGKEVTYDAVAEYPELTIRWMASEARAGREPKFMPAVGKDWEKILKEIDANLLAELGDIDSMLPASSQIKSKFFKNFFKDSKVVDENGEPLIVYHGTIFDFTQFANDKISRTSIINGHFFSDNLNLVNEYARSPNSSIKPVYLSLKNPMIIDAEGRMVQQVLGPYEEGLARDKGHDGFIVKNVVDANGYVVDHSKTSDLYVAFEPEQIKSATGNRGTFDPSNPDIRFMPSLHPEAMPVVQATDKKTGKPKFAQRKNAEGNPIKGKYDPVYETIDYDLVNSPLVQKHNKKANNKKVPWDKLSVSSLRNASTAKEIENKQLIQDIYNTDLVDIASKKLADEYTNVWSKDLSVQAGTGWYSRMRGKLSKFLGKKDHELFAQLLGATSARTPVEENFAQAFEAMTLFKQGKYDKKIKLYKQAYDALKKGNLIQLALKKGVIPKKGFVLKDGSVSKGKDKPYKALTAWIEHYDLVPKKSDDGNFNINSGQVMRVLTSSWLDLTTSPKTPNFAGNLTGRTLEATIDVWAGRYLRRMLYDGNKVWRIQPMSETGVSDVDFALGQLIFREAGKKLGMNPDDLQAIAWFGEKGVWEQNGWTSETGALKSSFDESFDVFFPKGRKPRNFQEGREIMSYKASQRLLAKAEDMRDNPGNYPDKTPEQIEKYLTAKTNEERKRKALPNVARFLNE